jgi:two-component system, OmpR family, KDP operon response regulator KdpE
VRTRTTQPAKRTSQNTPGPNKERILVARKPRGSAFRPPELVCVDQRMRPSVLAITDEPAFEDHVNWLLHEREFIVRTSRSDNAILSLKTTEPNAILLEVAPTVSSTAFAIKDLRQASRAPIITLGKDESPYEINYLREAGADDHLAAYERWTLVQSLRRCLSMLPAERITRRFPTLELDETKMRATLRGLPVELSPLEYALLTRLMRRPYCIVSSAELLGEVRQQFRAVAAHTIRASIHGLRRKVEDDPRRPQRLVTVLGSGYVFRPDV